MSRIFKKGPAVPHSILAIPALTDNYIWVIVNSNNQTAVVIDPGEAEPVLSLLNLLQLKLVGILITHYHWDHFNGVDGILKTLKIPVFGPAINQPHSVDHPLHDGDEIVIEAAELKLQALETSGHTMGHICYFGDGRVFTGDTLFTGGCGRIFEGTPDLLYHSLTRLAELDPNTQVYCGHEYTEKNLAFAEMVEPSNHHLKQRIQDTTEKISKGLPTVPSSIALERQTNPFLRCHEPVIQAAAATFCGNPMADNVATFAALRRLKDEF